ncbi:acyltransferase family protein [Ramlibacter sp. Leaf400]|uniref:acyltransferase family protein n=1 Tax=Ramlibacter sp. Leaf400 TaxID=1736365 RepID=UPI0009EA2E3F|nr:acyltransferase family protein [Ramlibacter sp. Leaf400]
MNFRPDIQGLRAIAVLTVVLFHAYPNMLAGGYIGVDVFFVISGYLITGIILRECDQQRFSLVAFYERRIRRIFPALVAVFIATVLAGSAILSPKELSDLGRSTIFATLFFSNVDSYLHSGYFDTASEFRPLLHTWSLAVEEQFYVLFPPIVAVLRYRSRRHLPAILLVACAVSLVCSELMIHKSASAAFFMAPSRGFELLIGAYLATGHLRPVADTKIRGILSLLGLGMIGIAAATFSAETRFPGVAALLPCIGAALLLHSSAAGPTFGGRLISVQPFRYVGDISYSLYLWHWPILAFCRHLYGADLSATVATCGVLVTAVLAAMSYHLIEQPVLRRPIAPSTIRMGFATIATCTATGAVLMALDGLPGRFNAKATAALTFATDFNPRRAECHSNEHFAISYDRNCIFGAPGVRPTVAIWGDSHAAELAAALGAAARGRSASVMQISSSACPPALDYNFKTRTNCANHNQATLNSLLSDSSINTVVLLANAARYDRLEDLKSGFEKVVEKLSQDKNVVIVQQIPLMPYDPPAAIARAVQFGWSLSSVGIDRAKHERLSAAWNEWLSTLATNHGARLIVTQQYFCDELHCAAADADGRPLYFNQFHLGVHGATLLSAPLESLIYENFPKLDHRL